MDILLDRRVLIEYPVAGQDSTYGTPTITWTTLATIWANVQDAMPSRAESVQQGLAVARNQVRIRYRHRADVNSSMRMTTNDTPARVLQIIAGPAAIGERHKYDEVMCESISS